MANELQPLSLLFQNRLFRIPDYQRGYAWQQSQLVDFWDDLNNLQMDRYHYTGLLSLKSLKSKETVSWGNDLWMVDKGFKPCHIVDGQQRLTTFIILLNEIVCFVCSLDENKGKNDDDIVLGYETIKDIKAKYICQKRPPQNMITTYLFGYETDNPSDKYLRYRVFNEPNSGEVNETYYTKNLKTAKEFFANNIAALYAEEGIDGLNRMYQKLTQKLMFNLHEIDDDYDVFVAFETMNNRGKRLTNLELLKNRLIYLTTIYNDDKIDEKDKAELRKQINEAWKEVYYQLGRNKAVALSDDDFLRAHWIIYYSYSRQKGDDYIRFLLNKFSAKNVFEKKPVVDADEQPSIYEEIIDDADDDDEPLETVEEAPEVLLKLEPREIADYVNSLKDLAKYWYDTWFPTESTTLSDKEKLWIDRLNRIGIGYFRPLVTVALSKCAIEEERVALFTAIERFIFICFRLANYRSNYQSTVYYSAARDIYGGKTTVQKITKDLNDSADANIQYAIPSFTTDIEKKLASGKKEGYYAWNSLRYFLYEYEYNLWESTGVKKPSWELFAKSEKDKVSIEHILPQTPSKWYWRNQFRQFIQDEAEMAALTGSLGNLLPLAQSINSSLQNDSFDEKKNPTNSGRRGYSSGSNSEIEVAKEDAWDGNRIYARCLHLLSFMEKRWNFALTQDQKEKLTFVSFVNDGRTVPEELPETEDPDTTQSATERRHAARFNYWSYALPIIREAHGGVGHPYGNVSPTESNSKDGFFGLRCIHLYCTVGMKKPLHCVAGLWIDTGDKEQNKRLFDLLYSHKAEIESKMTMPVVWNRKDDNRASSIDVVLDEADFTDQTQWDMISKFHAKMTKELADHIVTAYADELGEADSTQPQTTNRSIHLAEVFMMWASTKEADGEIILDREKCSRKYARFTTKAMTEVYPFADEANSGWNTKNFYFYEIVNNAGKNLHMQLALSGNNLPDNLRDISNRIIQHFPTRGKKPDWEWKCPFVTPYTDIPEDMSDEEIYSVLDDQYDQLMGFESKLVSILQDEGNDTPD